MRSQPVTSPAMQDVSGWTLNLAVGLDQAQVGRLLPYRFAVIRVDEQTALAWITASQAGTSALRIMTLPANYSWLERDRVVSVPG